MTNILRNEWRFDGLLMTDWESCRADRADPVEAIEAGTDLLMPGDSWLKKALRIGLKEGRLSRRSLERAAVRVLTLARRNGYSEGKGNDRKLGHVFSVSYPMYPESIEVFQKMDAFFKAH